MKSYKILIADDEQDHLLMLACMLRQAGYEVVSAFDAKHAIQLAAEQAPDLMLLDIHMGDEGGFAVQERLQKIDELAETPVIYITGDTSNWAKTITGSLGAHAMIAKPFSRDELLAVVKSVLSKKPSKASAASLIPAPVVVSTYRPTEAYIG